MNITPISESAVVCSLPPPASLQQQRQLWAFANQLQSEQDIVEVVVGMNNLTVFTDFYVDFAPLIQRLEQYWAELKVSTFQGRHIEIPLIYGGELGQDLSEVAKLHNTTPQKIVQMHSEPIYTVYMIGFQPGFPLFGRFTRMLTYTSSCYAKNSCSCWFCRYWWISNRASIPFLSRWMAINRPYQASAL